MITHARFYFNNSYPSLYEKLHGDYTYELLGGRNRFGSFATYSAQHNRVGRTANQRFKKLYGLYSAKTTRDYGLCLIASLVLLWPVWWAFMVMFLLVHIAHYLRLRSRQQYDLNTVVTLVYSLVLEGRTKTIKRN